MFRSVVLAAVLLGAIRGNAPAPAIITGVIRDPATRMPIAGAVVTINGDADSAVTDAAGRYSIRRPTQTEVSLGVKHPAYLALMVPMVTLGGDTLHFHADLHSNPVKLWGVRNEIAKPVSLIRLSPDSLIAAIGDSAFYRNGRLADSSDIDWIEVIKRRSAKIVAYGPAGQAGGIIRVGFKKAKGFGFGG
jgi:hypothetical protein